VEEKKLQRAQRQAEMDKLLDQLAGKLSKTAKGRKRAHSSDIAMVMVAANTDERQLKEA